MKCDELKSVYIDRTGDWVRSNNDTGKFYLKDEVDAVIAELKAKLDTVNELVKTSKDLYDHAVESLKATHDTEMVDAGMRERRLRRALWLLKTRYFWILMAYASDLARVANPSIIHKSNILANPTPRCMEEYQHEAELYDGML